MRVAWCGTEATEVLVVKTCATLCVVQNIAPTLPVSLSFSDTGVERPLLACKTGHGRFKKGPYHYEYCNVVRDRTAGSSFQLVRSYRSFIRCV